MYTLLPPRRLKDYQLMRYSERSQDITRLNKKYNYLVVDKDDGDEDVILIFNNYKTSKRYGQQIFNLRQVSEKNIICPRSRLG